MTSEQLQSVRAERWRQVSNPVVTADDAKAWLDGVGFCLFLPRRTHFATPAPSFAEAVAGAPTDAPSPEAVETAMELLRRLTAQGSAIPLNLFAGKQPGTTGGAQMVVGLDAPDFVATREALPYIFSLIGGRNWKSGPGAKASPLMTEIWTLLNEKGALTAEEIAQALGREVTAAAVLRAVVELWNGLRVIPVYEGDVTRWELTQTRFEAELTASQKVAQTTALSALVSLYLEGALAASTEEIETFLSPLAARSRVREVVNGLQATRQLGLVSVAAQPLLHVAGALPEFAEPEPAKPEARPAFERRGPESEGRPPERRPREGREERKPFERREGRTAGRAAAAGFAGGFARGRSGPPRDRSGFGGGRSGDRTGPPRERTGFGDRGAGRGERSTRSGERREFGGKPFEKRERPPFRERSAGSFDRPRPPRDGERAGERGARPAGGARFGGEKKFGGPKKFGMSGKSGGARFGSRGSSSGGFERGKPEGKRPFFRERREEGGSRGERSGGRPPFRSDSRSEARSDSRSASRSGPRSEFRPRADSRSGERVGGRGFKSSGRPPFKSGGKPGFKGGAKPAFRRAEAGESRSSEFRPRVSGSGGSGKPYSKGGKSFSKPGKSYGKPGKSFGKPGSVRSGSGRTGSGRPGKPAGGQGRPGGVKAPFRKRKEEGSASGE